MTHFLKDILRQPVELQRTIELFAGTNGAGRATLEAAAAAIRSARHVYLTGIGSSWHAALNVGAMFYQHAHPVYLLDADELLRFGAFPRNSAMIIISRSGKSTEIVQLARKASKAGVKVIGITNVPESPLGKEANHAIVVPITLDHAISVNTYTTLALAMGMLASSVVQEGSSLQGLKPSEKGTGAPELKLRPGKDSQLAESLSHAFAEAGRAIPAWQELIAKSVWLKPHSAAYFLARGSSLGSACEARLMWEEGVKSPASSMGTGSFRHGPQEIVNKGVRFGIWIDGTQMREQDFALARDLRKLGASVMLIGQKLPEDAGDLVFQLPAIPAGWQSLIDIIPAQLVAERLAGLSAVDCDTFRLSSFIVEDEGGLLPKEAKNSEDSAAKDAASE
ncbi:MAG TPA: SIS domain-containing protein [Candidatus Acidoferrum sp.]|nr:SIS domain-containing protein [Candidatus Acidoferrum sp.]